MTSSSSSLPSILKVSLVLSTISVTYSIYSKLFKKAAGIPAIRTTPAKKRPIEDVETPALILDLDIFEANMNTMTEAMKKFPNVALRPHAKAHKCGAIALKQVEKGAVGVCCQKLSEAEAMVKAGVKDVFISNEIVDISKIERMVALASRATVAVCVDNIAIVNVIAAAVESYNNSSNQKPVSINILVEVNVGQMRCGVEPGDAVVELAKLVKKHEPYLHFRGLHAYHGGLQHVREHHERKLQVYVVASKARYCVEKLKKEGIECEVVTGGGTGTFEFEAGSGVYNEVQPGSYIFMDADYNRNLNQNKETKSIFQQSLYIYTQVMSRPAANRAVVDAGLKALSLDSGVPLVDGAKTLAYQPGGDEHGIVYNINPESNDELDNLNVGDKVRLVPGHCDPTVNLYDKIVAVRGGYVEAEWTIDARGPGL